MRWVLAAWVVAAAATALGTAWTPLMAGSRRVSGVMGGSVLDRLAISGSTWFHRDGTEWRAEAVANLANAREISQVGVRRDDHVASGSSIVHGFPPPLPRP